MATDLDTRDELAVRIHDAVQLVAGVASMGSGRGDQIATYLPGVTVAGVEIDDTTISVEIVGTYPPAGSYVDLAGRVRDRARSLAPNYAIDVAVSDIRTEQ